jgi:DNA-binding response OmpR family regulator
MVVVAGDDLLFSSRIAPSLHALGFRPLTVQTDQAFRDALRERPAAAILNLASRRFDSIAAIGRAKAEGATSGIPLLGFCGHADTARQKAARDAGCDLVASNGEVTGNLARLLATLLGPHTQTPDQ